MMTVGQHDDAWLDVMGRRIPRMEAELDEIQKQVRLQSHIEALKIGVERGYLTEEQVKETWTDIIKVLGWDLAKE